MRCGMGGVRGAPGTPARGDGGGGERALCSSGTRGGAQMGSIRSDAALVMHARGHGAAPRRVGCSRFHVVAVASCGTLEGG